MVLGFCETNKKTGELTNFREQILSGNKRHSIRAGKRWKEGMPIQMATGVRTKNFKLFNEDIDMLSFCKSVQDLKIDIDTSGSGVHYNILIDKRPLSASEAKTLAVNDGFKSLYDFLMWFKDEAPFDGQIIHWTSLRY